MQIHKEIIKKEQQNDNYFKCIGNNDIKIICQNYKCKQQNALLCSQRTCKCYQKHKLCSNFHVETILQEISKKIHPACFFQWRIQSILRQFTNMISIIFVQILHEINQNVKFQNLAHQQIKFYQFFTQKKGQKSQFYGHQLYKIKQYLQIARKNKYQQIFDKYVLQIEQINKKYQSQMSRKVQKLRNLTSKDQKIINIDKNKDQQVEKQMLLQQKQGQIKMFRIAIKNQIQLKTQQRPKRRSSSKPIYNFQNLSSSSQQQSQLLQSQVSDSNQIQAQYKHNFLNQSSSSSSLNYLYKKVTRPSLKQQQSGKIQFFSNIIKYGQQKENLHNFFDNKVERLQNIFIASEHNFSMKKYYQKCGNMTDMVILVKTQNNKIIGGYTPISLVFNKRYSIKKSNKYLRDRSKSSFIFSLTQNQKFDLQFENKAIEFDNKRMSVKFGGGQLQIVDKGDKIKKNGMSLKNGVYYNRKFKDHKDSYKKLTGSQNTKFKVKQWEVFKVIFGKKNRKYKNNDEQEEEDVDQHDQQNDNQDDEYFQQQEDQQEDEQYVGR